MTDGGKSLLACKEEEIRLLLSERDEALNQIKCLRSKIERLKAKLKIMVKREEEMNSWMLKMLDIQNGLETSDDDTAADVAG